MREEKIDFYRQRLMKIGVELIKLAGEDEYLERLITGKNLLPIDQALKEFIEQFRK